MEEMILDYYEGIVQHMTNWKRPAPKVIVAKVPDFQQQLPNEIPKKLETPIVLTTNTVTLNPE